MDLRSKPETQIAFLFAPDLRFFNEFVFFDQLGDPSSIRRFESYVLSSVRTAISSANVIVKSMSKTIMKAKLTEE